MFVFVLGMFLFSGDLCFPGTAEIGDAPKTGDCNAGLGCSVVLWFCLYLSFLCICCCLFRTFFSQLATNARARGNRCAPQDLNMYFYACICMCFRYLRVFVFKTLASRWPAGKRASNYKWATGATKLLLLAAPFVRDFTPKKVRS